VQRRSDEPKSWRLVPRYERGDATAQRRRPPGELWIKMGGQNERVGAGAGFTWATWNKRAEERRGRKKKGLCKVVVLAEAEAG
jgi:hypothetical protein